MTSEALSTAAELPQGVSSSRVSRLRQLATLRRRSRWLVVSAPFLLIFALDLSLRSDRLARFNLSDGLHYLLAAMEGATVWAVLLYAAARRRGAGAHLCRGLFLFFFALTLGGQAYFFEQYSAYMNAAISRFATDFTESVLNQLWADIGNYLSFVVPVLAGTLVLLVVAKKWVRPSRTTGTWAVALAPGLLILSFFVPVKHTHRQPATPDVLYLHAVGALLETQIGVTKQKGLRPRARQPLLVPKLQTKTSRARNVVFVILESVRKDAVCNRHDPDCRRTPATNELFPERVALSQMRALDSSTAISLAVLLSGVGPHESRDVLHTWPLVFDYARQAGYMTAYWTSQNMMFGNLRLWLKNLGVQSMFTGNDIDPESDIDLGADEALFAERALSQLHELREPFFLTIQLSNGHYPYLVREDGPQPFRPASTSKDPENNAEFFNYYQNAIHQQDRHLARVLEAIVGAGYGKRTVVVYTSDHGEAFREHHQMGHTFSVYDEEVLVPTWIDAPEGTLSDAERENLLKKRDAFSFHPDLTATLIDLFGVWDSPEIRRFKSKILGTSLLRPGTNERPLPLSNCSAVWSCAFENWGYMRGHMKLEAREWDSSWHCWDLKLDPTESMNLGEDACGDLKARALATFGRLPGKAKAQR